MGLMSCGLFSAASAAALIVVWAPFFITAKGRLEASNP
jgi:hypothetical protein